MEDQNQKNKLKVNTLILKESTTKLNLQNLLMQVKVSTLSHLHIKFGVEFQEENFRNIFREKGKVLYLGWKKERWVFLLVPFLLIKSSAQNKCVPRVNIQIWHFKKKVNFAKITFYFRFFFSFSFFNLFLETLQPLINTMFFKKKN